MQLSFFCAEALLCDYITEANTMKAGINKKCLSTVVGTSTQSAEYKWTMI